MRASERRDPRSVLRPTRGMRPSVAHARQDRTAKRQATHLADGLLELLGPLGLWGLGLGRYAASHVGRGLAGRVEGGEGCERCCARRKRGGGVGRIGARARKLLREEVGQADRGAGPRSRGAGVEGRRVEGVGSWRRRGRSSAARERVRQAGQLLVLPKRRPSKPPRCTPTPARTASASPSSWAARGWRGDGQEGRRSLSERRRPDPERSPTRPRRPD